ncbi:MAG: leucine-rich repeat domain-containing protein [Gemmatimonadota bacterium]|nr:leucine-rich repeat domain-containing protein [Gemmatimonadota bacterium]
MDLDANGTVDLSDFLAFAGVFGTTCPVQASPPVTIPDANLRAVIEDGLGKARGAEITRAEMAGLTRLEAASLDISDLTGLEYATNLTHLELRFNKISDVSSLSGLTNLYVLDLGDNRVEDLSALSGLKNLRSLWLGFARISDVSPLSELNNLTELSLAFTNISDISPLSGLTNLTGLSLQSCSSVSDFSPLAELISLEALYLSEIGFTDLSPLAKLTSLELLFLDNNGLSDLRPLSGLTALEQLYLYNNRISDVSALSGLTNIQDLQLQNNKIRDLAPLVANTGLGKVAVKGNPLNDTSINVHIPALEARGVRVSFDETIFFGEPRIYNDNVFVLPVTENLAAGNLPLDEYATRFYTHFSDAFDFLVFFPSLTGSQLEPDAFKGAFHRGVGNDVQGIGKGIFFSDTWGSAGRLQSGVFFASVSGSGWEHTRLVRGPMLHELMHRWANFIMGPAVPHWDFTSADGILGGFDIAKLVDNGGGRYSAPNAYTRGWAANVKPYSPIELYLAGLIPPEQVPDLWVAADGEQLRNPSGRSNDSTFTASRVRTYTIEDIITEHGRRVPDHRQSQKAFRAAVILLVSEDYPAVRQSLEALSSDATLFSHAGEDQFDDWYNFYEATGGRATIAMDGLSRVKGTGASKRPAVRSFGTPPPPIVCHLEH